MLEAWRRTREIPVHAALKAGIRHDLDTMPGVIESLESACGLIVTYDVRVVQFGRLAECLQNQQPFGRLWRWKAMLYDYMDQNSRDHLQNKQGGCCNKPPARH
ncbi:hypothetical protein [Chitinilyticum litopenaei]|uniref:hypothetical protein n=1 Tax=Chitinilyticum litopenaei TaxID=1121276 RepID=UPI0011866623|nr:hypothetical protein [Chitinilyticum litopenaei]